MELSWGCENKLSYEWVTIIVVQIFLTELGENWLNKNQERGIFEDTARKSTHFPLLHGD